MNHQEQKHNTSLGHHRSVWEIRSDGWINLVDDTLIRALEIEI